MAGVVRPQETSPARKPGLFSCLFPESRGQREPSAGPHGHRLADVTFRPLLCGNSRRNRPARSAPMANAALGDSPATLAPTGAARLLHPRRDVCWGGAPHQPRPMSRRSWPGARAGANARDTSTGLVAGGQHDENRRAQPAVAGSRMGVTTDSARGALRARVTVVLESSVCTGPTRPMVAFFHACRAPFFGVRLIVLAQNLG